MASSDSRKYVREQKIRRIVYEVLTAGPGYLWETCSTSERQAAWRILDRLSSDIVPPKSRSRALAAAR